MFASTHADPAAVEKQKEELTARAEGRQKRYSWDYDEHFEIYQSLVGEDKQVEKWISDLTRRVAAN